MKKCSKGKPCGSTCVQKNVVCRRDFPATVSKPLSDASRVIQSLGGLDNKQGLLRELAESFITQVTNKSDTVQLVEGSLKPTDVNWGF